MTQNDNSELSAEQLTDIGQKILSENKLPKEVMVSHVLNTSVGMELFQIGLVRSQAKNMQNLFEQISVLEEQIFNGDYSELNFYDKVNLYRLAKESFSFRMDLIKSVSKNTNWNQLSAELLKISAMDDLDDDNSTNEGSNRKVRQILAELINSTPLDS